MTLIGIGERQLWRDEHATWWAASLSLPDLWRFAETVDFVLVPYYVVLHGWVAVFGDSAVALRLPSALCIAGAAALTALVGRRLFDATAGLFAGLLLAAVPAVTRYGQEARPYAMAVLASVAAVLLLLRALERPSALRWLYYGLAVALVAASHLVALMALAAHLIAVVAAARADRERRRRILIGWAVAAGSAVLVSSPLVLVGRRQGGQISWVPDPTWERVQLFPADLFMSPAAAGFFLVLGLAALAGLAFKARVFAALLAVWALLPAVLAYYTFHEFSFFYPRYLLFTIPAWVLAAAYALRRLTAEAGARGAGAAVLAATLAGLTFVSWDQQVLIRGDGILTEFGFRPAAAFIRAHQQPGDAVVFAGYQYAYRGFRYEWRDLPPERRPREALIDPSRTPAWSWRQRSCRDPAACLAGITRIWVVSTDPRGPSLSVLLPPEQGPVIEARYEKIGETAFPRIRVTELRLKSAP
ncbi:glycosyltransferase family 39 protein [Actinoplanes sp. NPDC049668]|uniref:glycosyltransferase family 39 protein n=1 Tax=unclassified Actinoplanes TaxID=2626549 RepID=UPI0033AE089D